MSALSSETIGSKDADRSLRALALAAHARGRRPVAPLMGYPGLQLTASTVKQNQFNWDLQRRTLVALYERYQPDAMFFLMDLSVEVSALGLLVRFPLHETPSVEEHPVRSVEDLDAHRQEGAAQVIIVEGLMTLQHRPLRERLDLAIYIDAPSDERIVRRLRRNMAKGIDYDEIAAFYLACVRFRPQGFVEPSRWHAAIVLNGSYPSERGLAVVVEWIRQHS